MRGICFAGSAAVSSAESLARPASTAKAGATSPACSTRRVLVAATSLGAGSAVGQNLSTLRPRPSGRVSPLRAASVGLLAALAARGRPAAGAFCEIAEAASLISAGATAALPVGGRGLSRETASCLLYVTRGRLLITTKNVMAAT